jgi:hypothetical protein
MRKCDVISTQLLLLGALVIGGLWAMHGVYQHGGLGRAEPS